MNRILVLGAGRSCSSLIHYLQDNARQHDWTVTVGDVSLDHAREKVNSAGQAIAFDIRDAEGSRRSIAAADLVVSLLPAHLHTLVAAECLAAGKHFISASYVTEEMKAFDEAAREKGLIFLNECGLDPGIDHLSAMKVIDAIRSQGGSVTGFESFAGGLIAPETDPENPWRYKFTWNPHNVVTAGQTTARYLQDGEYKYIPYHQLFRRITPIHVPGLGDFEGYANRNSLKYIDMYGLEGVETMLRGTLRHKNFCAAWNVLVQLGCCDDHYEMTAVSDMTHAAFIDSFLPAMNDCKTVEEKVCTYFGLDFESPEIKMLRWSGFFDTTPVGLAAGTPATILEHLLNKKWALHRDDKDMIVMWHRFRYKLGNVNKEIQASLVVTGTDAAHTAMARTVGLPLAIATRLILAGKIKSRGVIIPTAAEFYHPILEELATMGIVLNEWSGL